MSFVTAIAQVKKQLTPHKVELAEIAKEELNKAAQAIQTYMKDPKASLAARTHSGADDAETETPTKAGKAGVKSPKATAAKKLTAAEKKEKEKEKPKRARSVPLVEETPADANSEVAVTASSSKSEEKEEKEEDEKEEKEEKKQKKEKKEKKEKKVEEVDEAEESVKMQVDEEPATTPSKSKRRLSSTPSKKK